MNQYTALVIFLALSPAIAVGFVAGFGVQACLLGFQLAASLAHRVGPDLPARVRAFFERYL